MKYNGKKNMKISILILSLLIARCGQASEEEHSAVTQEAVEIGIKGARTDSSIGFSL